MFSPWLAGIVVVVLLLGPCSGMAQCPDNRFFYDTLNRIVSRGGPSSHFAEMYLRTVRLTDRQAKEFSEQDRNFVCAFQQQFIALFLQAHEAHTAGGELSKGWKAYYTDDSINELQRWVIGMNAHINGDMWQALRNTGTRDTLLRYRKVLLGFQRALNTVFDSVFVKAMKYRSARRIHRWSLGLDRSYGKRMVLRWRKRQMKLALLWHSHRHRFNRKLSRTEHRMAKINRRAMRMLKR